MSSVQGPSVPLLQPHPSFGPEASPPREEPTEGGTFGAVLDHAVRQANAAGHAASAAGEAFAAGAVDDIHGTMLALSKAEIELRYVGAVRNKIVDAFYELWRMQI